MEHAGEPDILPDIGASDRDLQGVSESPSIELRSSLADPGPSGR